MGVFEPFYRRAFDRRFLPVLKDPERMLGVLVVLIEAGNYALPHLLSLESVVHANQEILDIRFGAEVNTMNFTDCNGVTKRAEAHEIVFEEHRPVRREHPFDTSAGCPAGLVLGDLANLRTETIGKGYIVLSPRRATLPIEQEVRSKEIADATRQGIEPARLALDGEEAAVEKWIRKRPRFVQARAVEHIANAKHPRARLVIAADLTATSKAAIGSVYG